jgi:alkanesulfonate monooxygenase SsuD/methylene tetrahydromethanopterin reductase-like flavin-dependent oxidoreductase (luciferase family)
MQHGLYLPNFGPFGDARLLAGLAQDAESAGWDGFFIWDHVAAYRLPHVDPWVALSAIALSTDRIRIGTTVTPLPRRRPWKVAREAVSVDRLSDGRLTLGVGIGGGQAEWGDFGEETGLKTRGEMLDEALEILVGLWSGQPFHYSGAHYTLKETQFLPPPLQRPRIPIWVGGVWPNKRPLRRAAQWDGVFPLFESEDLEEELAQIEETVRYCHWQRRQYGRPEEGWDVVCMGVTPEDRAAAAEMVRLWAERGVTWWLESITPFRYGKSYGDAWPLDRMRQVIQQGPPVLARS